MWYLNWGAGTLLGPCERVRDPHQKRIREVIFWQERVFCMKRGSGQQLVAFGP